MFGLGGLEYVWLVQGEFAVCLCLGWRWGCARGGLGSLKGGLGLIWGGLI